MANMHSILFRYTYSTIPYQGTSNQELLSETLIELGVTPHNKAKNIEYISYESRLNSFTKWPKTAIITPERVAAAGFFYTVKL
ncbi:hypothetical protein B4U80_13981 [Leptotrombidium deliense]|uniref:Uncharacterized protein n=1 Tax=Leptotrombidium deliense TaxID=299467 RepID=A0A443S631_9ACAR|nr:hypothetical protein B4U80_13981 [Leptotrombidium deliense]